MKKLLLALAVAIALTTRADAGGCVAPYVAPAYVAPIFQKVVVVQAIYPVFTAVPVVFSVAQPVQPAPLVQPNPVAPVAPAISACEQRTAALEAKLARLEALLAARPSEPGPRVEQKLPRGKEVLVTRCGACHEASKAQTEGGGFVLMTRNATSYDFSELSPGQQNSMYKMLLSKKMPPPLKGKLEEGEGGAIIQYIAEEQWAKKE